MDTRTKEHTNTHSADPFSLTSVAFSPDGNMIASGSDDGTILLWKVR